VVVVTGAGPSPLNVNDEYTYTYAKGGYGISLAASMTSPTAGGSVTLTATANQDVGSTPYGMSILDVSTNTEVAHVSSGTSTSTTVSQPTASTHRYVAYVS